MGYSFEFTSSAEKELNSLDLVAKKQIYKKIDELKQSNDPKKKMKPMQGKNFKKLNIHSCRVGKYRMLCEIENEVFKIICIRVCKREDVYRKFKS